MGGQIRSPISDQFISLSLPALCLFNFLYGMNDLSLRWPLKLLYENAERGVSCIWPIFRQSSKISNLVYINF